MIKLTIKLIEGFRYATDVYEFPVDIEISTDSPTAIQLPVRVHGASLTARDDSGRYLGYRQSIFHKLTEPVAFLPHEPIRLRTNVFENTDEFDDYVTGTYCCKIMVLIFEEETPPMDLWGSLDVTVV